jgi:dipeptidase E
MNKILALSSSRVGGGGYLESAARLISPFLGPQDGPVAFLPFASVDRDYPHYAARVQEALPRLRIQAVTEADAARQLEEAAVIMVGGGNTFKLLHDLYHFGLLDLVRSKVAGGCPYIGWSAGANIAGRGIGTTNDMPIIQPRSFAALGFFPSRSTRTT